MHARLNFVAIEGATGVANQREYMHASHGIIIRLGYIAVHMALSMDARYPIIAWWVWLPGVNKLLPAILHTLFLLPPVLEVLAMPLVMHT